MPANHAGKCLNEQGAEELAAWAEGVSPAAELSKPLCCLCILEALMLCKDKRAADVAELCKK